jgi:anti-anti-sigma factor
MSADSDDALSEPFRIEVDPHRETIVVAAHGEIDIDSAGQLDRQVHELLERGFARIVLDLRNVTFLDSSGLHVILDASAASADAGVEFAIVQGPSSVQRVFEVTQTASALRFIDEHEIDGSGR